MRTVSSILVVLLLVSGCSIFGGGEKVHKSYIGPASLDQEQVTELLNQQGYSSIVGLHKNGDDWIGSAMNRDGTNVAFDIDKSGTIHTK